MSWWEDGARGEEEHRALRAGEDLDIAEERPTRAEAERDEAWLRGEWGA